MNTKYGSRLTQSERWRLDGHDRPRFAKHLLVGRPDEDRGTWDKRTPAGAVSPETAWLKGTPAEWIRQHRKWHTRDGEGTPDEVRVYGGRTNGRRWAVALIRRDNTVRTVFRARTIDVPVLRTAIWVRAGHPARRVVDDD